MELEGMKFADGRLIRQAKIDLGDGRWVCPVIVGKQPREDSIFSQTFLETIYRTRELTGFDPISGHKIK